MTMLSDDLDSILADTDVFVAVSYGSAPVQTTRGDLRTEDVPESDGQGGLVLVARRTVTIRDGSLTGLLDDAAITVNGTAYVIHEHRLTGQSKRRIVLARAGER
jgi:hypothetical protein